MIAAWLLACGDDPAGKPTDPDPTTPDPTEAHSGEPTPGGIVWDDVSGVFAEHCTPCHVETLRPAGGFSADRPEDFVGVIDPETSLAYVEPGDLARSWMWRKLEGTHLAVPGGDGAAMPPVPLPAADLRAIQAWIEGGALAGPPVTTPDDGLLRDNPACDPVLAHCESDCVDGPASVTHGAWSNRLTTSPTVSWDAVPQAVRYEVAVGSTPGGDDAGCWTDVGSATEHAFTALWSLEDGGTYHASVRAFFADGTVSALTSSDGWTVDIQAPEAPTAVDDDRAPVDGAVSWSHPGTDDASGFVGYEVALGTAPFSDDAVGWTPVGADPSAVLGVDVPTGALPEGAWYWVSVRATDEAGNASQPGTSPGWITCPPQFAFVPGDAALGTTPFCLARYEMRITGQADGAQGWDGAFVAESRPDGTPWSGVDKGQARVACDGLGFAYQLVSNVQWQTAARSIERTPENWSGGALGAGSLNRGHCDEDPLQALASDGDPCTGTNNPACLDPVDPDWSQKRTHVLANGETIWDLAGNLREQVDGSTGGPDTLWTSYDGAVFTTDPGWEDYRLAFGPEGPWTSDQGTGRIYGGSGNLTRGGSYNPDSRGAGGSQGELDVGVFGAHHNTWSTGGTEGFRCVFVPM
jgi:hypothetical protein